MRSLNSPAVPICAVLSYNFNRFRLYQAFSSGIFSKEIKFRNKVGGSPTF